LELAEVLNERIYGFEVRGDLLEMKSNQILCRELFVSDRRHGFIIADIYLESM